MKFKIILILLFTSLSQSLFSQFWKKEEAKWWKLPELKMHKYGTLVGIQRGKYFTVELGVEKQIKQVTLKSPNTLAWNAVLEYAWESNAMGLKPAFWYKTGRAGLTYGAGVIGVSDFEKYNFGLVPSVGFKIIGFHAAVNYNLLFFKKEFNYNTLNLSIRYFISRDRELKRKK